MMMIDDDTNDAVILIKAQILQLNYCLCASAEVIGLPSTTASPYIHVLRMFLLLFSYLLHVDGTDCFTITLRVSGSISH